MKTHIFRLYRNGYTHYWCGREEKGHASGDRVVTAYMRPETATCQHCLKALRDFSMRRTAFSASISEKCTERLESLRRKNRKKKG